MRKGNRSFTQQECLLLWRRDGGTWVPTLSSRGVTGKGQGPWSCWAPRQAAESWGPGASCRKSTAGLRGVCFQRGGQGARLPRAPWGAGPAGPASGSSGSSGSTGSTGSGFHPLEPARRCPGSARASGRPDADQAGERSAHSAAPAARCPWFILHSGRLSLLASLFSPGCAEGKETWLKSPCWDLLQRAPQPTPPPLFHDAKGPWWRCAGRRGKC